ncbi:MAG: radical SAM protein [bacterium]|nr:radical SAM protein [bacterium]
MYCSECNELNIMGCKVLLICPRTKPFAFTRMPSEAYPQLALGYLTSYLRNKGIEADLIDANALNLSRQQLINSIKRRNPDIVGITVSTPTVFPSIEVAKISKELGCKVVMGGVHPTALHDSLIKKPFVDIIVIGEGEQTLLEIAQDKPLSKIDGISYMKKGKVIVNKERALIKDLDSIPFPAWDSMPINKYAIQVANKTPCVTMLTSRGCYGRCIHCSSQIIFKRSVRFRSAKNVVDEIELLVRKYGVKYIYFIDYLFVIDKNVTYEVCREIKRRKLKFQWWAETRVETVDKDLLRALKDAGCDRINYGIESGDQQILNNMKRGNTLKQIRQTIKWSKEVGLKVTTTFMLGCLGETKETANKTIDFAVELDADEAQFSIYTPYPGTEYYDIALKQGIISKDTWQDYSFFTGQNKVTPFRSANLTSEELQQLFHKAYKRFYFRPRYMIRQIPKVLSSPFQMKRAVRSIMQILRMS